MFRSVTALLSLALVACATGGDGTDDGNALSAGFGDGGNDSTPGSAGGTTGSPGDSGSGSGAATQGGSQGDTGADTGGETGVADSTPPPNCGDGIVDRDEQCDDGAESATCTSLCSISSCGDGIVNVSASESCDDAGESATCDDDCTFVECGDLVVNATAGEACEGKQTALCDIDCTAVECGDGTLNTLAGEVCDDGGESASCDVDCTPASCGDAVANMAAGEACDDAGDSVTCDADCTAVECGDGDINVAAGEECDDGMPPANNDGCSASCESEFPHPCDAGTDPITGSGWVVCSADANEAWISHSAAGGGNFHPDLICAQLGYAGYTFTGGTCGNVCGFCEGPTSCMAPGAQNFAGGGECGTDVGGTILCFTVQWLCVNP